MQDSKPQYGEVHYYFLLEVEPNSPPQGFAMVSPYSPPDIALWEASHRTVWSCTPAADDNLSVVPLPFIKAVVAMVPHPPRISHPELEGRFFVVEKLGIDSISLFGATDHSNVVDSDENS